ncbi:hypothetical protein I7I53_09065 [Histoplasma capsulatum var. duboisii H88]|uniref:Uncharacterized protein n=1 Tax=Ajellomyces capsulatus (strain H88) TaxID=544711 RepID=A0A8A1L9Y8_AJEC8|nr:hypothetical protein I7I53_09065 [Histoplasma capsulatum var. duboisii H88]
MRFFLIAKPVYHSEESNIKLQFAAGVHPLASLYVLFLANDMRQSGRRCTRGGSPLILQSNGTIYGPGRQHTCNISRNPYSYELSFIFIISKVIFFKKKKKNLSHLFSPGLTSEFTGFVTSPRSIL